MKYLTLALMVAIPGLATAAPGNAGLTKVRKTKIRGAVARFMKQVKAELPDVDVSRGATCITTSTPKQPNQSACVAVYRASTGGYACVSEALTRAAKGAGLKCIERPGPTHALKKGKKANSGVCLSFRAPNKKKRRSCDVESVSSSSATATGSVKGQE